MYRQYGNSKAVPIMLLSASQGGITPRGSFWFFAAVTLIGLPYVWFFLPETKTKSLEAMDELFSLPWYQIGRKGRQLTEGKGSVIEALASVGPEKTGHANEIEKV